MRTTGQNGTVPMTGGQRGSARSFILRMANRAPANQSDSKAEMGGGNLQIEQLHALVDVHLLAPAKTMTARERLDAEFVEAEATQVASTAPAKSKDASSPAPDAAHCR